jgi:hypothetical protein
VKKNEIGSSGTKVEKVFKLFAASILLLFMGLNSIQIAVAATCVREVRYCTETLPDGKCKLWGTKEIPIVCGDKNMCSKQERYCTETLPDGKCKLWGSRTVTAPC